MKTSGPLRVGIGGPVGSGKTTITAELCKSMRDTYSVGVVTNDIYTQEDRDALVRMQALSSDRIIGVETGGCPHTAIREDASINLQAIAQLEEAHPDLDVVFCVHTGFEGALTWSDFVTGEIVGATISVHFWRESASDVAAASDGVSWKATSARIDGISGL